jgi:hypothetical protein
MIGSGVQIPGGALRASSRTGICGGFKPRVFCGFESRLAHPAGKAVLRILARSPLREEQGRYSGGSKDPRRQWGMG